MLAIIYGLMKLDFTNDDGEKFSGTNLFAGFEADNVIGLRTERFFVKSDIPLPEDLEIGDEVELSFNYRGKLESVTKA